MPVPSVPRRASAAGRRVRRLGGWAARAARTREVDATGRTASVPGARVTDYKAPHYWLDYREGFVRRALPGAVLRWVVGGPPTVRQVDATAVVMSRLAAASVVPLVAAASRRAAGRRGAAVTAGVLLSSPLTGSLLLRDAGRYDAVGVLAASGLACAGGGLARLPPAAGAAVVGAGVGVATACEEFLVAVLAPVAVGRARLLARHHGLTGARRAGVVAAALGPGAAVAAASLLAPVPGEAVAAARREAAEAGVRPVGVMGDALGAIERGLVENLAFFRIFSPSSVAGAAATWVSAYIGTVALLDRLLTRPASAALRPLAVLNGLTAAALSVLGADFRRWWGLATVGLVAGLAVWAPPRSEHESAGEQMGAGTGALAAALVAAGLAVRRLPVHPSGPLRKVGAVVP